MKSLIKVNILVASPDFNKELAIRILDLSSKNKEISLDPYYAVCKLEEYPCPETKKALVEFLKLTSKRVSIKIAQRKAVQVLSRMPVKNTVDIISKFLYSDDPFTVENTAWALQELNCNDPKIHLRISELIDDPQQNRRVLIQSLAKMNVINQLSKIKIISKQSFNSPGVIGASIAAVSKFTKKKYMLKELQSFLKSRNQNNRQMAIQDIIDANAIDLLSDVNRCPVSPFFRIRATEIFFRCNLHRIEKNKFYRLLDNLVEDRPENIDLYDLDNKDISIESLVNQLFNTDFNSGYFALKHLVKINPHKLWPLIYSNLDRFQKDYGALYFLFKLFYFVDDWQYYHKNTIEVILKVAINSDWPEYVKFRPAAILCLIKYDTLDQDIYLKRFIDQEKTTYWFSRYSVLFAINKFFDNERKNEFLRKHQSISKDPHPLVVEKFKEISSI